MQFLKEEDKEYAEFEIDIKDESKRGNICFCFEKVFRTFFEDEYIAGNLNMVVKFRKTSESKFKSQSYSSIDNEGEFVKFAGLEEVKELEDLELSYQDYEIRNKKIFEFIEQNNVFKQFFYDENYKEFEVSLSSTHQDCDVVWINNVFTLQENKQLSFLDKVTSFFKK
ncbi:hypothetical protein [Campylobacter sp. 2457A]|uniref:hypothetical protein n=1 Tax=Campylobacter sp. 2457A TaxID=2735784 RepID=UPI00301DC610|nr:hypothetical protein [Campylobacter sp. 2457A]